MCVLYSAYLLEAAADAGLDVVATEWQTLSELSWNLDALLQQQTESGLVHSSSVVGYQTEQTCSQYIKSLPTYDLILITKVPRPSGPGAYVELAEPVCNFVWFDYEICSKFSVS